MIPIACSTHLDYGTVITRDLEKALADAHRGSVKVIYSINVRSKPLGDK